MPLAQRSVFPKNLGCTVPGSVETTDYRLIPVEIANQALVKALQQLTCLVRHADDIFCDIAEECQKVVEKTERIQERIGSLSTAVENLNYKDVPIPVGDLKVFCQKENSIDHFQAKHGYNCHLFTGDERPQCVKDRYSMAMVNPVQIIRCCDNYRKDGLRGSMLFKQWPVMVKEPKHKTPELSLRKLPLVTSFEKEYKPLKLRNIVIKRTNSNEEKGDEIKPDTTVVPIDTSGVTFQRMRSFRLSLRSTDDLLQEETTQSLDKNQKRKRRQTFSGVPQNVWKEICAFESSKLGNKRNSIQDKLKSYSFDDLDSQPLFEEGEIMKYLNQVEERIEEREELEQSQSENKFLRLIPCRRSCSLPRSAKLLAHRNRAQTSCPLSKCEAKSETGLATLASLRASSCGSSLSLHSAGSVASSRQSRSTKRSSIIGVKIRSFISSGPKLHNDTRPKSLDLDALDPEPRPEPRPRQANMLNRTPSMPEGMVDNVGPGSFYYFESNTLPRTQAKKYDFPWESLPKDWTTSVKLREISKRKIRDDRNSSSGNWSGSSARQSMESERAKSIRTGSSSQKSLDSGRESPTPTADGTTTDTAGEAGDEGSLMTGDAGESCSDARKRYSALDTEAWLRNLAIRAAARDDSSSSSETLASLVQLTKQNIDALDGELPGDIADRYRLDDDASSVYSLDQEGFYTSFHNDSGLRRSTTTLWEEEEAISSPIDENDKSRSVCSVSSNLSVDSVIYKPSFEVPSPVIMRPPQKRQNSSGADSDGSATFNLPAPTPQPSLNPTVDFSFSESDQELIYARVKQKTRIPTAMMYPSMCEVSSSDSEEDGTLKSRSTDSDRLVKHKPMFDPEEVAVVELSPPLKSSLGLMNNLHNFSMESKGGSTSQTLSTFSSMVSSAPSELNSKGDTSSQTVLVYSKTNVRSPYTAETEEPSTSQTLSGFSSLGSTSRSAHPMLKHSESLDDSNLLGSTNKDMSGQKQVFNSLPRHYHLYKRPSCGLENTNSWPRSRQSAHDLSVKPQPSSGILKSKQKTPNGPKTPKTLNFAPVVNMFDPGTPEAVQVLLSNVGNSPIREVNPAKLPQTNSFKSPTEEFGLKTIKNETYRPVSSGSESDITSEAELPAKYLPTLIVRPGTRSAEPKSSSKSDISPYATSPVSKIAGRPLSMGSSVSGTSDTEDRYVYRKGLVTSPTVDSGIGSVGDLSPSTPTSSIEGYDDLPQDEVPKTLTSSLSGKVFTSPTAPTQTEGRYVFMGSNSAKPDQRPARTKQESLSMSNGEANKGTFGQNLEQTCADIEFADDSDGMPDTLISLPTQGLKPAAVKSVTSVTMPTTMIGYKDKQSSSSDSKLLTYYRNTKVIHPATRSSSALQSSALKRTHSPLDQPGHPPGNSAHQLDQTARTSSYRNACTNATRASSYRMAQNDLTTYSNGTEEKKCNINMALPSNYRSDSYRVACKDILPPTTEDNRRADSYRLATKAGAKTREQQDPTPRAESYRHAMMEEGEDPEVFEYKPVNKRAAITSLDQLLPKPVGTNNGSANASKGLKSPKPIKRSITESGFFARFRGKPDKTTSKLNGTSNGPVKGSYVPLGLSDSVDLGSKQKSASYRFKPKSSTYVSFDVLSSVEEVKEDSMTGSLETLKAPSLSSLQSFQNGQSNPFLRGHSFSETDTDDHQPLVDKRSQQLMTSKSHSHIIKASSDQRRSTGSTNSTRVNGGPHVASSYRSFKDDSSIETGV